MLTEILTLVVPDMSIVPNKYHAFVSSPLRRVFLDAPGNDSRAVLETSRIKEVTIKNLNAEIAALNERVTSLERDKVLLSDRYQSAKNAVATLRLKERNARFALEDKLELNRNRFRAKYDALKHLFFSILFICYCFYQAVLEITQSVVLL